MKNAQDRTKHCANKRRSFREFEVGHKIFWKVTPQGYNLTLGNSKKLSPVFCGPFDIVKRIGPIAYKLKLLEDYYMHYVVESTY